METHESTTGIVSPVSRLPLYREGDRLTTAHHREAFAIEDGIIVLLSRDAADATARREMDVFDDAPVTGVSYFRSGLYSRMIEKIAGGAQAPDGSGWKGGFAELGGGEGYCARVVKEERKESSVYVCDVSRAALGRSPDTLIRICADVTQPIFAEGSLQAAAFWVSLHHIPREYWRRTFEEVHRALEAGGVFLLFEPNAGFFPRRLMYQSPLRNDVYFDEHETAVDFIELADIVCKAGFEEVETVYLNPPYNFDFVRKLKRWYLYFPVVEALYCAERVASAVRTAFLQNTAPRHDSLKRFVSLYGMAVFRKPIERKEPDVRS